MEKKNVFGLGLLLIALIVIGGSIYYLYNQKEQEQDIVDDSPKPTHPIVYSDLNLEYDYLGDNVWRYTVTGTLPNPCYSIETEAEVAESAPEQITIRSTITAPEEDEICAQVIQEVLQEGEFQASEDALVIFERL